MHAISSGVLIGFVVMAAVACGGDSKKDPLAGIGGSATTTAEAGAGSGDDGGDGGSDHGGAGPGGATQTGATTTAGGMPGAGGSATSTGGTSVAGAGGAPEGSGGDAPDGSVTSGGATSGASTTSSTGGMDLIEPPPGCESVSQSEDADSCAYQYKCDGRTHFDSCTLEADGSWSCECGTFSTPTRYFEIGGVEALEACSTIARVCEGEYPVSPTRVCRPKETVVEGDTCKSHATCGNEIDLGPGIVARAVERRRSECKPVQYHIDGEGEFDCSCVSDTTGHDDYRVAAASVDAVCEPMLAFCLAEAPPTFSGGLMCSTWSPIGIVEQECQEDPECQGCTSGRTCRETAPIAEGVSIIDLGNPRSRSVACRPEDGELSCYCYNGAIEGVYSDYTVPGSVLDVCKESIDICPL